MDEGGGGFYGLFFTCVMARGGPRGIWRRQRSPCVPWDSLGRTLRTWYFLSFYIQLECLERFPSPVR